MTQALLPISGSYYAVPSKPAALYDRGFGRFGGVRCFSQGLGAAIIAYTGVNATASPGGAPLVTDFTSLDSVTLAMLDGRLTGPTQIIAAIALFITAHHSTPRLLGLLTGTALVYFHMQGLTVQDALLFAGEGLQRLSAVFELTSAPPPAN